MGTAGISSLRVSWDGVHSHVHQGQSPRASCGMSLLRHQAPSCNVVVNYAINPTSNNINLVFTPITPTGKLFSDLPALEAKIVLPPISSLN